MAINFATTIRESFSHIRGEVFLILEIGHMADLRATPWQEIEGFLHQEVGNYSRSQFMTASRGKIVLALNTLE